MSNYRFCFDGIRVSLSQLILCTYSRGATKHLALFVTSLLFFSFSIVSKAGSIDEAPLGPLSLECIAQVNVSLDEDCEALVTPDMVLTDVEAGVSYTIILKDEHGQVIPGGILTLDQLGQNITYEVFDDQANPNSCWGKILVEVKIQPVLNCTNDTISCTALDVLAPPALLNFGGNCLQSTFEISLINEVRNDTDDCDSLYTSFVTRTYQATDGNGNTATCAQQLLLTRLDTSKLEYPVGTTIIKCSESDNFEFYDFNEDDEQAEPCLIPIPWLNVSLTGSGTGYVGVPYLNCVTGSGTGVVIPLGGTGSGTGSGTPLIPEGGATLVTEDGVELLESSDVCNTWVSYTDQPMPSPDGCNKKVFRTWNILEWHCNQEFAQPPHSHIIEIVDDMAPEFDCPPAYVISSDYECGLEVQLPDLSPSDGCGHGEEVKILTPFGQFEKTETTDDFITVKLAAGPNQVKYIVSDNCSNSSECIVEVTLRDGIDPVAICEQNTVISLSSQEKTQVASSIFDDGSWDECGDITSCAVKMADVQAFRNLTPDTIIDGVDHVLFSNYLVSCPLIDYLSGTVIDGQEYLTEDDLCQPYINFCCSELGDDVMVIYRAMDAGGNSSDCMVNVELQGVGTTLVCPPAITRECIGVNAITYSDPTVVNDCGVNYTFTSTFDSSLNSCGLGDVVRTVRAVSPTGLILNEVSCTQKITIVPATGAGLAVPFPPAILNVPDVCSLDELTPTALGSVPTFDQSAGCSQLGYDFVDAVSGNPGCYNITRTWTVIDWCTRDATGQFMTYEGTQQITTSSTSGPIVTATSPLVFPTDSKDCERSVTVSAAVSGGCTAGYTWSYSLLNVTDNIVVTNGSGFSYTAVLEVDSYRMTWTVTDGCGNQPGSFVQEFEVESTKAPKPVCNTNYSIDLNAAGTATLVPSVIDAGSSHPCYPPSQLILAFDEAGQTTQLVYGCADVNTTSTVSLWVMLDPAHPTNRKGFCTAQVTVNQGLANCLVPPGGGNNNLVKVSGTVHTEQQLMIESVEVILEDAATEMTDIAGAYAFESMPMGGSYVVTPRKNSDHLNGVSTLDLIMIQRHILGIEELAGPYKQIAADVNSSASIDGVDLVELRKLILGIYEEFPENTSWRFFDESKALSDIDPWGAALEESYEIPQLDSDMDIDFIGVKIGDVNDDASTYELHDDELDVRSQRWPLIFTMESKTLYKGETTVVNVSAKNYERISGWQGTLRFDADIISVQDLIPGSLDISSENFNLSEFGTLAMSYGSQETREYDNGTVLFQLKLKADETIQTDDLFSITSDVTRSEAYRGFSEEVPFKLEYEKTGNNKILLAIPNPFVEYTTVEFQLEKAGNVLFEFYDTQGRLIHDVTGSFESGKGSIKVEGSALDVQGVIYIKMITDNTVSDFKMIRL